MSTSPGASPTSPTSRRASAWDSCPRLAEFTDKRRALARRYFECFDRGLGCELPPADFENSNWHMFQVVLPERIEARRIHRENARAGHRDRRALSRDPPRSPCTGRSAGAKDNIPTPSASARASPPCRSSRR